MKLSDLANSVEKKENSSASSVKLSDLVGKQSSEEQNDISSTAETVRQFIGKGIISVSQPTRIGEQVGTGRLTKPDPIESSVSALVEGAVDTATFGIPRTIAKRIIGASASEPKDKMSYDTGRIIGLLAPAKLASSLSKKIPGIAGRTLSQDIARGAVEGAAIGFTYSPDEFMDIKQRITQAVGGAAFGAASVPISKGLQNLSRVAFKAEKFAQGVRKSLFQEKQEVGKTFETQLNNLIESNPSKVVNIEDAVLQLREASKSNSRIISDIASGAKRAGLRQEGKSLLERLIESPESAKELTLNQTRDIKKIISEVPSIKQAFKKGKFGQFSETDIDLLDFTDGVKQKQLSAFPEMQEINSTYSNWINKYNLVKDKFKVGKLLDNIEKNFGDKEVQGIVKQLLPKEVIDEMGGYRSATKFLNLVKWISIVGAGGVVAGGVGRKVFGGSGMREGF